MTDEHAALKDYLTAMGSGAILLRSFHGRKHWHFDTIAPRDAKELIGTASWLYGKTRYTMQQRKTREAAIAHGFSLSVLTMIRRHVEKLSSEREQWVLWRELTNKKRPAAVINTLALKRVKELTQTPAKRTTAMRTVRGADGMGTLYFTAPQAQLADINRSLDKAVASIMEHDSDKTKNQARGEAFAELLRGDANVPQGGYTPLVVVPVEEHAKIIRGEGDGIKVVCSDGTVLSDKEYLERLLMDYGLVALVDEEEGTLNMFRTQRFANQKQRFAAFAENPTCVAPGCTVAFDDCQLHHVVAWKNGGDTNITNLVPLCAYHNGINDDDWWNTIHGHIEKRGPFAYWVSAYGLPDRRNQHPLAMLGGCRKIFG
ncbi:HNH endonuclease signature motif containing protein [Corynebacterium sp. ZY180755]